MPKAYSGNDLPAIRAAGQRNAATESAQRFQQIESNYRATMRAEHEPFVHVQTSPGQVNGVHFHTSVPNPTVVRA
jgi:hypothetical protein